MKRIQSFLLVICIITGLVLMSACSENGEKSDGTTSAASDAAVTESSQADRSDADETADSLDNAKSVAEKFTVALTESDYNELFKYYAMDIELLMSTMFEGGDTQELLEFYGVSTLSEFYDQQHNDSVAYFESTYGEDYKITAKATDCTELDEESAKSFIEKCKNQVDSNAKDYDIESEELLDTAKIEKVAQTNVKCKISGSIDESEEDETTLYCVFIDGSWKIVDDVEM